MKRRIFISTPVALLTVSQALAAFDDDQKKVPCSIDDLFTRLPKAYADHHGEDIRLTEDSDPSTFRFTVHYGDSGKEAWACPRNRINEAFEQSDFKWIPLSAATAKSLLLKAMRRPGKVKEVLHGHCHRTLMWRHLGA